MKPFSEVLATIKAEQKAIENLAQNIEIEAEVEAMFDNLVQLDVFDESMRTS